MMAGYSKNIRKIRDIAGIVTALTAVAWAWAVVNQGGVIEPHVLAASTPSYSADIALILQKNCLACHSSTMHKSGLILESYSALIKGGKHGSPIHPHDAKGSLLIQMLEGDVDPQMPMGSDPLPVSDINLIKRWIDGGAEGPPTSEVTLPMAIPSTPDFPPQVAVVSPVTSVKFSPDGKVLAVGGYREVRLIDPVSGKALATLAGHANYVRSLAFSPDGKLLAAAGGLPQIGGEIKIWDVTSHQLVKTMEGHKDCIYSIAWSPDGKLIASGSYDRAVKLWDVAAGKETLNLQDHIDAVFAVAFGPDGKRLASASQDRTVKIWDVATGKRLYTLSDALDGLTCIAYSPSGDRVAAAGYDKTIYIWRLGDQDGHLIESLIADEDSLLALEWSPDGKTLVTASSDGFIRFRNTKLDLMGSIDKQSDWVESLAMSPDGKWLATGRYNGTLSLYDTATYKEMRAQITAFDPGGPRPKEQRAAASQ
ncbi:MAG: c-type cytochrome domain-containing protein [Terracidiphilus sp.]|jgi:WD40 repeat protein